MIAEVLLGLAAADPASGAAPESGEMSTHGFSTSVEDLIAAAVSEVSRVTPSPPLQGGVAPVLGAGVVHGLLRQRREQAAEQAPEHSGHVDERL